MSTNASSLRRILRSIGSHALPTANTPSRHPSNLSAETHARRYVTVSSSAHTRAKSTTATIEASSSGHLDNATQQNAQEEADSSVAIRRYTAKDQAIKDGTRFWRPFSKADQPNGVTRMKQQARRRQISKERNEISEDKAWRDILLLLDHNSPQGSQDYLKRMETIRLPEGIFARWTGDPGGSVLEIMQRTGSHVQVIAGKDVGLFSSLTLLGKPAQNATAKRLLQESGLLAAVSEDDLNASKSLADYQLRSEILPQQENKSEDVDGADEGETVADEIDDVELELLQTAVTTTTNPAPTRAVWSNTLGPNRQKSYRLTDFTGETVLGARRSTLPRSALAFTARIDELTAAKPRQLGRGTPKTDLGGQSMKDELVAIMTNPDHVDLITPLATGKALRYLAHHMHFPAVRAILNALKDVKLHLDADLFNSLLHNAAKSENVMAFHYGVHTMRSRGVVANLGTWTAFFTLMLKRYPAEADKVIAKMKAKAILADPSAQVENIEAYSATLLVSYMDANPTASIRDFVENLKRDMPGIKWFTSFAANRMCHLLLKRGNTTKALEAVDELVRHGGRPDVVTLNLFLTTAKNNGDMEMAVETLRKFRDLHTKSTPLASTDDLQLDPLPRVHDLSVAPNRVSFRILCSLAWERSYFNCLRVFWRYACCAGHLDLRTIHMMRQSVVSKGASAGLAFTETSGASMRGLIWKAWAAKFAIDVKAGLGSKMAAEVEADVLRNSKGHPRVVPISPSARRYKTFVTDQGEVHSLRPTRALADIAVEAWLKDRTWKQDLLGLPQGQDKHGSGEKMLDVMLKYGIEVPVEVGDAVGMTL